MVHFLWLIWRGDPSIPSSFPFWVLIGSSSSHAVVFVTTAGVPCQTRGVPVPLHLMARAWRALPRHRPAGVPAAGEGLYSTGCWPCGGALQVRLRTPSSCVSVSPSHRPHAAWGEPYGKNSPRLWRSVTRVGHIIEILHLYSDPLKTPQGYGEVWCELATL